MKVKGNTYCPRCDALVVAEKATHRARGVAIGATAGLTSGASLLLAKSDPYVCTVCGARVAVLSSDCPSDRIVRSRRAAAKDDMRAIELAHRQEAQAQAQLRDAQTAAAVKAHQQEVKARKAAEQCAARERAVAAAAWDRLSPEAKADRWRIDTSVPPPL